MKGPSGLSVLSRIALRVRVPSSKGSRDGTIAEAGYLHGCAVRIQSLP